MKKIVILILMLTSCVCAYAGSIGVPVNSNSAVYRSSFTAGNETKQCIATAKFLNAVIIASATAGGTITVYDSIGTTQSIVGVATLGSLAVYPYNVWLSSGLTYTTSGNSYGVTLIWK